MSVPGTFEAVVGVTGVPRENGGIYGPGCVVGEHLCLLASWNHDVDDGAPAVGLATVRLEGDQIVARGRFDTFTESGMLAYKSAVAIGDRLRWSMAFSVTRSHRDENDVLVLDALVPWEVSPVADPACPGTMTLHCLPYRRTTEAAHAA